MFDRFRLPGNSRLRRFRYPEWAISFLDKVVIKLKAERSGEVNKTQPYENAETNTPMFVPPGHFYSPIANLVEVKRDETRLFERDRRVVSGIELREREQRDLLKLLSEYYRELPFHDLPEGKLRYGFLNPSYSYSDAIFLYCIIRHFKPERIIEVGSGYSSCLMLDTNDLYFDGRINCEFIDPYPALLFDLLGRDKAELVTYHPCRLQDVDVGRFAMLEKNDILFIDSTHVVKVGSDVNYLFFEVLPILKPGVLIHLHDVFYPFEYPKSWIYEGRSWSEAYLLRAFLQYNESFEIVLFNTFLEYFHREFFVQHMPLCLKNEGGSIWLKKVA